MCNNGIVFPVIYHHQDIRLSPIKILQFLGRRKRLEGPLPHHHTANAHTHTHCVCVDIVSYTLYSYKQPRFYIQARLFCLSSSRQSNGREREMNERTNGWWWWWTVHTFFFAHSQSQAKLLSQPVVCVCVCGFHRSQHIVHTLAVGRAAGAGLPPHDMLYSAFVCNYRFFLTERSLSQLFLFLLYKNGWEWRTRLRRSV